MIIFDVKDGVNMVKTVNGAFNDFLKEKVNLDSGNSISARSSRNWLMDQIHDFPNRDNDFPTLYSLKDIYFGSFARKTQIRPLDDIDIMVGLSAEGSSYDNLVTNNIHEITVPQTAVKLRKLCNDGENTLNSIKVINKFKKLLSDIPQYEKAEIKRNQEAVTLKLTSYDWNFDIVPCFFTVEDNDGRTYYLIPDGNGSWKKTDPRMDRDRVTDINQKNDGKVLNAVRIMKYWNKRPTMPTMPSYLLENIVLNRYDIHSAGDHIDFEVRYLFDYIRNHISNPIQDPKNIQGDINQLDYDEKIKIIARAGVDYNKAVEAWKLEKDGDHESAIKKWKEIFGSEFPDYS